MFVQLNLLLCMYVYHGFVVCVSAVSFEKMFLSMLHVYCIQINNYFVQHTYTVGMSSSLFYYFIHIYHSVYFCNV